MSKRSSGDYDDYDDHGDSGHKSQKSSYKSDSSHDSSSRENFGKTSSFNTMLSDEGKFFGVNLDSETRKKIGDLYPLILPTIVQKGEELVNRWNPKFGNAVGWALALGNQALQVGDNIYKSIKSSNDLRVAVQPLNKVAASSTSALSGNNEVIANARGRISSIFWQRNVDTLVSTIGALPAIIQKASQHSKVSATKNLQKEIEEANGDLKVLQEIEEKRLAGAYSHANGDASKKGKMTEKDRRTIRTNIELAQEKEYEAKFIQYKKNNLEPTKKTITEELKKLTVDDHEFQLGVLKKNGLDTSKIEEDLKYLSLKAPDEITRRFIRFQADRTKPVDLDHDVIIKKLIEEFQKSAGSKAKIEYFAAEKIKDEFVKREGAWDNSWITDPKRNGYGSDRELTHKEKLKKSFEKLDEETRKADSELLASEKKTKSGSDEHGDSKNIVNLGYGVAGGVAKQVVGGLLGDDAKEKYKKPIALDRILHLRRVVEQPKDNLDWKPPEEVPPVTLDSGKKGGESKEKSMSYAQFVHEIFQQHQRDSKRVEIGERYFAHFEKVRWDDKKIQEMPDSELSAYEYAVKTLAKRIKDGRMDALALVELVGNSHGKKIVQNDGRTFGPQGAGKDENDIKAAILALIDERSAMVHTAQEKTEAQVNDKLANFVFSVEDMKAALETDVLDREQRTFIFTMFSDVVGSDEKLCQKLGIKTERCIELRKESQEHINQTLDSVVAVLADMIDKDPKAVEASLKITDKEKTLIKSLAKHEHDEGKHVVDLTKDREEVEVLKTLSANAAMILAKAPPEKSEGAAAPISFWQRVKNKIEDLKKPKEEQEKPSRPSESRDSKSSASKSSSYKDDHEDDKPSHKSHDHFDDGADSERETFSHREKFAKRGHDHDDTDHHDREDSKFTDRPEFKRHERHDGKHADKLEPRRSAHLDSKHSDRGEHPKKWTADKRGDDDGYGSRIRRNRVESDAETSVRGGLT